MLWQKKRRTTMIVCLMIVLTLTIPKTRQAAATIEGFRGVPAVEITVLVDNNANGTLQNPWGVSMLVETNNHKILFDAGLEPEALEQNTIALGKNISDIDCIVISHEHGDHYFGLPYVAEACPNATVYVPGGMSTTVREEIINYGFNVETITTTTFLYPGIAIIGQLWGPPFEHALAVNVANVGLVVVVGCSHPGVQNIVEKAVNDLSLDPYLVIGGFHLGGATTAIFEETTSELIVLHTKKIYPIHCSGDGIRNYIAQNYPDNFGFGCVGTKLVVDQSLTTEYMGFFPVFIFSNILGSFILLAVLNKYRRKKQ